MSEIVAEIITIGDEILYGQITDTNSQWISAALDNIGIKVIKKTTIGDVRQDILDAFEEAEKRADVVLITGGLGPTNDDLTKPCLAEYFDTQISMNQQALEELTALFSSRGYQLTETNRKQAELPENCQIISNHHGTAPGMWFERNGKIFASMPGVPFEMKALMTKYILPKLREYFTIPTILHKMVMTVGIGESWLSDQISEFEQALPDHIKLAYLPSLFQVKLRLTGFGNDIVQLEKEIEEEKSKLKKLIGEYIFGYDGVKIEEVIGDQLKRRNLTIATAESCTGGFIAHKITSIPGSSAYFNGGIIPYQNNIKVDQLNVEQSTLDNFGAVSEQTVIEMANHVREKFNANIGVASSGIAGPSGGTPEKPVGTVWISYADGRQTVTKKLQLGKLRDINIQRTTIDVFYLIWQRLTQNDGEK